MFKPHKKYIDKEFKNYLGCGILAKGFAYGHCEGCHKDFLIAFSCKGRGICPSCNLTEEAMHFGEVYHPRNGSWRRQLNAIS